MNLFTHLKRGGAIAAIGLAALGMSAAFVPNVASATVRACEGGCTHYPYRYGNCIFWSPNSATCWYG